MLHALLLSSLLVGQVRESSSPPALTGTQTAVQVIPIRLPARVASTRPQPASATREVIHLLQAEAPPAEAPRNPATGEPVPGASAPLPLEETPRVEEEAAKGPAAAPPERWILMKAMQGTWMGYGLDAARIQVYGWTAGSYNLSSVGGTNSPVVWDDQANQFMLQQHWVRIERPVVTDGTTQPTWGFRSDWLFGTDYRFTLANGLLTGQLTDNRLGQPNQYGVDPISFYGEVYIPTVAQGLDIRVGRWFTPFGVESLEAVSSPTVSKSYAFNWAPPFTHVGLLATWTLSDQWTLQTGIANGNDVWLGPQDRARFVGTLGWSQPGGRNVVVLGASLGQGRFNQDLGVNNINVFDVVWNHIITPRLVYTLEGIYGYQYGVPLPEGRTGTANWMSVPQYLFYDFSDRTRGMVRLEFFEDFQGSRTGFHGLYSALTFGLTHKIVHGVYLRPELRGDYNANTRPFQGNHGIVVGAAELIMRW